MTRRARRLVPVAVAVALAAGCTGGSAPGPGGAAAAPTTPAPTTPAPTTLAPTTLAPTTLAPAPPTEVPPTLTQQQVDQAVGRLDALVQDAMTRTGVPGVAVAAVHRDQVVYSKGFGVREVDRPDAIDPDTVFQIASVSKPLASTVVAGVVGREVIGWDDPVVAHSPGFSLADPYVTRNATVADLLSHRSGFAHRAGDLLEDLGFDRTYILGHLNQQPLDPFRSSYNYSNFGYTAGARPLRTPWGRRGRTWPSRPCSRRWA